jgi:hypothetical protein
MWAVLFSFFVRHFYYGIFIHVYNVLWSYSPPKLSPVPLLSPSGPLSLAYGYFSVCFLHRFHKMKIWFFKWLPWDKSILQNTHKIRYTSMIAERSLRKHYQAPHFSPMESFQKTSTSGNAIHSAGFCQLWGKKNPSNFQWLLKKVVTWSYRWLINMGSHKNKATNVSAWASPTDLKIL